MLASLATIVLAAASSALALPHEPRGSSSCTGIGAFPDGGPYDFYAYDYNYPNGAGVRLTLAPPLQVGSNSIDRDLRSLATFTSYKSHLADYYYTPFNLSDGGIVGQISGKHIPVVSLYTPDGSPMNMRMHTQSPAQAYCGLSGTSMGSSPNINSLPQLSYIGDVDHWSLCSGYGLKSEYDQKLEVLVYKADPSGGHGYDSCRRVLVRLVDAHITSTSTSTSSTSTSRGKKLLGGIHRS